MIYHHSVSITKYPIPFNLKSQVIYQLQCRGCEARYIGKTDRCLTDAYHLSELTGQTGPFVT